MIAIRWSHLLSTIQHVITFGVFCQHIGVCIRQYRLGAHRLSPSPMYLACAGTTWPSVSDQIKACGEGSGVMQSEGIWRQSATSNKINLNLRPGCGSLKKSTGGHRPTDKLSWRQYLGEGGGGGSTCVQQNAPPGEHVAEQLQVVPGAQELQVVRVLEPHVAGQGEGVPEQAEQGSTRTAPNRVWK